MTQLQKKKLDKLFDFLLNSLIISFYAFLSIGPSVFAFDQNDQISFSFRRHYDKSCLRGEIWYGMASWYGPRFHGKKTSNGEKYDKRELTAAHKELPFNTKVLVTNLQNNKSVVVRINDRGPFVKDRIIDLSEKAAEKIDLKRKGTGYIKIQVLTPINEDPTARTEENQG